VVFLATEERAKQYAKDRDINFSAITCIKGWGHINAPMLMQEKINLSKNSADIFPHYLHKR
jgi:acetyl-CoA C-acetyltransferase